MKTKQMITTALMLAAMAISSGTVHAEDVQPRGPIPFAVFDRDGNGTIDESEFSAVRDERQQSMKTDGRMGKNRASAPAFTEIDTDKDGQITAEELTAMQPQMDSQRRYSRDQNRKGCRGEKRGEPCNRGPGNTAMDEETRAKYDAFLSETTDLRRELAAKRAEKRAVMHSSAPDPELAGQLTAEFVTLRSQLLAKREAAGLPFSPGTGYGREGKGRRDGQCWKN